MKSIFFDLANTVDSGQLSNAVYKTKPGPKEYKIHKFTYPLKNWYDYNCTFYNTLFVT